jgi:hypothetical protein
MENLENEVEKKKNIDSKLTWYAAGILVGVIGGFAIGHAVGKDGRTPIEYENRDIAIKQGYVQPKDIQRIRVEDLDKDGKQETTLEYKIGDKNQKFILQYDGKNIVGTPYEITINKR